MESELFLRSADRFADFHLRFADLFGNSVKRVRSAQYLVGLLLETQRRNIENLIDVVEHVSAHALQRFITHATWSWTPVIQELQRFYGERLSASDGLFVLDDTGVGKQGTKSVGVARQYSGTLGKVGNCQIGVFLAYVSARGYALIDARLYLPKEWTEDPDRCRAAGVPEEHRTYRAKTDLALDELRAAQRLGVLTSHWVTADEAYGESPPFRDALEAEGYWYVLEVPSITPFFAHPAKTAIPPGSGRGRKPTKPRLAPEAPPAQEVRTLAATVPDTAWDRYTVAIGEQGPRTYEYYACRGWESREGLPGRATWLLLRRNLDKSELKYYFSNAPAKTPPRKLARVGAMRWCVETAFEQGKSEGGLDEYEVRTWPGWYHHMTLVLLAMAFLLLLTQEWGEKGTRPHAAPAALADPGADALPALEC